MNTITPNARRVYMSRDIASSCANMCLFIADCQRFGLNPTPYNHALAAAGGYNPDYTVFTIERGVTSRSQHRYRCQHQDDPKPTMEEFGLFPTNMETLATYALTTARVLRNIYGMNGVPLAYLIRSEANPAPGTALALLDGAGTPGFDYDAPAIACCSFDHPAIRHDQTELYRILLPRLTGTSAMSLAPADHATSQNGRALFEAVWRHQYALLANTGFITRVNDRIRNIYYLDENRKKFSDVVKDLSECYQVLFHVGKDTAISERQKVINLVAKTQKHPDLAITVGIFEARPMAEKSRAVDYQHLVSELTSAVARV